MFSTSWTTLRPILPSESRLHDAEARAGDQVGPGQGAEARKGHCAHARFPAPDRRGAPELLNQLKAAGYKIVHMKAKEPVKPIAQYNELENPRAEY
jgi:hypothetical protein